jgi:hypothetical protein
MSGDRTTDALLWPPSIASDIDHCDIERIDA